jgi:hypothetical protein
MLSDPLGLTTYEGFSPLDEADMRRGVEEVRNRLGDCCAGSQSQQLLGRLEDVHFVADASLETDDCAVVDAAGFVTNTIRINPLSLADPGTRIECCAPAGMIVHELQHTTLRGRIGPLGEIPAFNVQIRCFGCGQSAAVQDHLTRTTIWNLISFNLRLR